MSIELAPRWAVVAQPATVSTWSAPAQAPASPNLDEIVGLITDLFAEGVLTGDQLAVIGGSPEMKDYLTEAISRAPCVR